MKILVRCDKCNTILIVPAGHDLDGDVIHCPTCARPICFDYIHGSENIINIKDGIKCGEGTIDCKQCSLKKYRHIPSRDFGNQNTLRDSGCLRTLATISSNMIDGKDYIIYVK